MAVAESTRNMHSDRTLVVLWAGSGSAHSRDAIDSNSHNPRAEEEGERHLSESAIVLAAEEAMACLAAIAAGEAEEAVGNLAVRLAGHASSRAAAIGAAAAHGRRAWAAAVLGGHRGVRGLLAMKQTSRSAGRVKRMDVVAAAHSWGGVAGSRTAASRRGRWDSSTVVLEMAEEGFGGC